MTGPAAIPHPMIFQKPMLPPATAADIQQRLEDLRQVMLKKRRDLAKPVPCVTAKQDAASELAHAALSDTTISELEELQAKEDAIHVASHRENHADISLIESNMASVFRESALDGLSSDGSTARGTILPLDELPCLAKVSKDNSCSKGWNLAFCTAEAQNVPNSNQPCHKSKRSVSFASSQVTPPVDPMESNGGLFEQRPSTPFPVSSVPIMDAAWCAGQLGFRLHGLADDACETTLSSVLPDSRKAFNPQASFSVSNSRAAWEVDGVFSGDSKSPQKAGRIRFKLWNYSNQVKPLCVSDLGDDVAA